MGLEEGREGKRLEVFRTRSDYLRNKDVNKDSKDWELRGRRRTILKPGLE